MPLIRPACAADVAPLAARLRAADRDELAAHGREPHYGLLRAYKLSGAAITVEHEGDPLAMVGFAPVQGADARLACPWMLAADALTLQHGRWFARNTPRIISAGDHLYDRFVNFVDARNTVHVRWLRWAGFTVLPPAPLADAGGLPFHMFHRTVDYV